MKDGRSRGWYKLGNWGEAPGTTGSAHHAHVCSWLITSPRLLPRLPSVHQLAVYVPLALQPFFARLLFQPLWWLHFQANLVYLSSDSLFSCFMCLTCLPGSSPVCLSFCSPPYQLYLVASKLRCCLPRFPSFHAHASPDIFYHHPFRVLRLGPFVHLICQCRAFMMNDVELHCNF